MEFDDNIGKEEREVFLNKLRSFIKGHEKSLHERLQTFNRSHDATTLWDPASDTVALDCSAASDVTSIADTLGRGKLHNRLFFRTAMAMSTLVFEMKSLTDEAHEQVIPPLSLFGDDSCTEGGITDEAAQKGVGWMVGLLQDVWNWLGRVKVIVCTVMRNFGSLYSEVHARDNYAPYTNVHFTLVWHTFIDLLSAVVAVEEILQQHDTMRQGLGVFKRMLAHITKNLDKFEVEEDPVQHYGKLLGKLERDLLDDGILLRLCSQGFDSIDPPINVTNNRMFYAEFNHMFDAILSAVVEYIGTPREGEGRRKYLGLMGLFCLHQSVFANRLRGDPSTARKFCKALFDLHRKAPVIYIYGVQAFKPAQWLARRAPHTLSFVAKEPVKEAMQTIQADRVRSAEAFLTRINHLTTISSVWLSQMLSSYPSNRRTAKQLVATLGQLLQRGILFAQDILRTVRHLIVIHQAADAPLSLALLDGIGQAVATLMMIRNAYHSTMATISTTFSLVVQSLAFAMQKPLYALYQRLNDVLQSGGEAITDQHSAIGQALALLQRPPSPQNVCCLDIVLSIAFSRSDGYFQPSDIQEAMSAFTQYCRLANLQKLLRNATDCDFLYWQREGFYPHFFKRILRSSPLSILR